MTTPHQPGWYDDPDASTAQRYWDGQNWSPQRRRKPFARPAPPSMSTPLPPPPSSEPLPAPPGLPPPPRQEPQWPVPAGEPPQRTRAPIIIAIAVAVVALAAVVGGVMYKSDIISDPNADQIRAVVQNEQAAFNNLDYNAFIWTLCSKYRTEQMTQLSWVNQDKSSIAAYGPIEFTVTNIKVTGDTATADLSTKGQKEPESRRATNNAQFVRESGKWTDCTPAPPSG